MWLTNVLRSICCWLDKIIYSFISTVYNLLFDISNANLFDKDIFEQFSTKIYALIGIVMLFRVSISIFSYIVDPDAFLDKSKGFTKIIQNVVLTFCLLIMTPFFFRLAMDFQTEVIKSNFLGKLFIIDDKFSSSNVYNPGDSMAYETLVAFYHFDTLTYSECDADPNNWDKADDDSGQEHSGGTPGKCRASISISDSEYINIKKHLQYGRDLKNVNLYMSDSAVNTADENGNYVMVYMPIISTLAGGAIVLILLTFCFDVAMRNVKLGFLQMLAPVPIISRIDPKKGKEVFDKWTKSCISTYLDLFIRLLSIHFSVFVISLVFSNTNDNLKNMSPLVSIFIIFGALLFAKELPNFIKELTGFDSKGTFSMNPLKKFNQVPIAGSLAAHTLAYAGGAYTGIKAGAEAGHVGRGLIQGIVAAHHGMNGKIPFFGAGKDAKLFNPMGVGTQSAYKAITGKEYEHHSLLKDWGKDIGKTEIEGLKKDRRELQGFQASLDAQLDVMHKKLSELTPGSNEYIAMEKSIKDNRAKYGEYQKYVDVINDQINDVKRLYTVDESPQTDVRKARAAAALLRNSNNNQQATPPSGNNNSQTPPPSGNNNPQTPPSRANNNPQVNPQNNNPTLTQPDANFVGKVNNVDVYRNSNGELTSESGLILPNSIKTDDR